MLGKEILNRNAPRHFPSSNATTTTPDTIGSPTSPEILSSTASTSSTSFINDLHTTSISSQSRDSSTSHSQSSSPVSAIVTSSNSPILDTSTASTGSDTTFSSGSSAYPKSETQTSTNSANLTSSAELPTNTGDSSITGCSYSAGASNCESSISATFPGNFTTETYGPTKTTFTSNSGTCTVSSEDDTITEYSIVYTATVTFFGNHSAYSPPYPTIETPNYCGTESTLPTLSVILSGTFPISTVTLSSTDGLPGAPAPITSHKQPTPVTCAKGSTESGCQEPAAPGYGSESSEHVRSSHEGKEQTPTTTEAWSSKVTVTFVTTDKNPSVVYPSNPIPNYSNQGIEKGDGITAQGHKTVPPNEPSPNNGDPPRDHQSVNLAPQPTYAVTARGKEVIINDKTISHLDPSQTITVTVGDGTFTIYPTAVVGEGATVKKPRPVGTAVSVMTPKSATVGGLPVFVSGSEAVIDGTTFNLPPAGTTTEVNNEVVSIGPGKVVVDGQTMTFQASGGEQSDVVVTGGEMVTAIGQSIFVFHSTTLTYGPNIRETTEVVDDDTITIGPSAVIAHGTTMGGTTAAQTDTTYEIVGGATITKLSPSYVIIDGTTYTAGPGASSLTKVIGGETITIGPDGVIISTTTLSYPFGSSTVTTIKGSATESNDVPDKTGESGDGEAKGDGDDSAGSFLKPSLVAGLTGLCMAVGVWVLI
ncbi:hypothetical protein G7046_g8134 [Stylonectria norvegica]|nr:hypothetical protein G7046_g8134 [Stylonectria norvegica]